MGGSPMPAQGSKPCTIVIFGASGDLTSRKLLPALFSLYLKDRLPDKFNIIGYTRRDWNDDVLRQIIQKSIEEHMDFDEVADAWKRFSPHLHHIHGGLTGAEDYQHLHAALPKLEEGAWNRLYYLAVPPRFFTDIVSGLAQSGMADQNGVWRRIVIEKPFGSDLDSARSLNQALHTHLDESQIYRIDHYLGKETVQNVLVFRFANTIFEPIWNRNYIEHIQITVAEEVGVGHRAGYYDGVGVIKDMFQNHLMQLLTLVAMEPPAAFQADALRNEKVKVLNAIRQPSDMDLHDYLVRGQYRGYRDEEKVAPNSETPTYAAIRFDIENWRWQGVPFFLRSGKRLAAKTTEIIIHFKRPPHVMFPLPEGYKISPNILALCIQPDEGIHLRFDAKVPDTAAEMRPVDMEFHYADDFGECAIPEAYERLLLDALIGDASLFTRSDEIERAWELMDPFIDLPKGKNTPKLEFYEPGSWGPAAADTLLGKDGRRWLRGCADEKWQASQTNSGC
jgi:glucose-6-phosphate 1-dehydrogenase